MIKIDFHMHTVATPSDSHFEFDMERLKEYVRFAKLDAIAITNHNIFDLEQFIDIKNALDISVFPAIEIDLETGHLLLIADKENVADFSEKCSLVSAIITSATDSISVKTLKEIFPDLGQYMLIPHYDKSPPLSKAAIGELSEFIVAGEVSSPKKFIYCIKNEDRLTPVYFSDSRMSDNLTRFPVRQTYLGCDDTNFSSIKYCLSDKAKVSLSATESNKLFTVFDDGQQLSTGLNVVLGERSTGKSYTLNKINNESEGVKYIKQFSLVERDEAEDKRKFDKLLSDKRSLLTGEYLDELQAVVSDIIEVDLKEDGKSISDYIDSLVKFAKETERHDSFSKAKLFSEEEFQLDDQTGLKDLIKSTKNLILNKEFKSIVEKYVSIDSLKKLVINLMETYAVKERERLKRRWINELIFDVKSKLEARTAATAIKEIDLYKVGMNLKKVEKFERIVAYARTERIIKEKPLQGFSVVAKSVNFKGAGELKNHCRRQIAFSDAFSEYNSPYAYLKKLQEIEELRKADLFEYFVKIEYKILNRDGFEVSGGERSEVNLLEEIQDAQKYDMLLIDEPESSFDNHFLKKEVNELIKELSKSMPVVLVTHNSTVGASIKPEYLLCTKKETTEAGIKYRIYSGFPASKELISTDLKKIDTFEVTMGCLEAGQDAYDERRMGYENLKNQE